MGTTASANRQPESTTQQKSDAPVKQSPKANAQLNNEDQGVNLQTGKVKSLFTNKVAPVVITCNLKEEFQVHDDLRKAHYCTGSINDNLPGHYLVLGKYFLVKDLNKEADSLQTSSKHGAPNFRRSQSGCPVYGMGQPTMNGFKQVLQTLKEDGYEEIICFNVREEPVLFLHQDDDFVPYTPRDRAKLKENIHNLCPRNQVENLELTIKKEILDFAALSNRNYYVYHDVEQFVDEPRKCPIKREDDIHVSEEVYRRHVFTMTSLRYKRLPLSIDGAAEEADIDAFIEVLRETPSLIFKDSPKPPPAFLFNGYQGIGRTDLGMIMGALVISHRTSFPSLDRREKNQGQQQEDHLPTIQALISCTEDGSRIVDEVGSIVGICSEMYDLKEAIYQSRKKLETDSRPLDVQFTEAREYLIRRFFQCLEQYFYLIVFNKYLHEQYPMAFSFTFSTWMRRHGFYFRLLSQMPMLEMMPPANILSKQICTLVADDYLDLDEMSSKREMKVANFRRVSKMPVYGMAQPNSEALGHILSYLTDDRRHYTTILCVNLREDVVLEGDGEIFSLRDPERLMHHIMPPAASVEHLEKIAVDLMMEILSLKKPIEVWHEQDKQMKEFKSCLTLNEIYSQMSMLYSQVRYHRLPIDNCATPSEKDFDAFFSLVKPVLVKDSNTALVFNCHDGKGRTTTGMVTGLLIVWHINGFPEDYEEELVSVPDAKYTKGEFEAILSLVRILPNGNQMKKEVDMALDAVSDIMTPMMYHLRETIINTYRKV
uniref:Phosphatase domain containing paladin 1 n=1 Tax=Latimeria chalumnae TaxID=7897 RepID=H3B3G2_LATCH